MFVGIDISHTRGCAWAAIAGDKARIGSGWVDPADSIARTAEHLATAIEQLAPLKACTVAIDAPRGPIQTRRKVRWASRHGWVRSEAPLLGRHAEVVIRALNLANPQWTPTRSRAADWMKLGFALFERLADAESLLEVFPSASYTLLDRIEEGSELKLDLRTFARGPKDMLDAYVAALTAAEFSAGRGCEVGGADGLGTIVLPRPLDPDWDRRLLAGPEHGWL